LHIVTNDTASIDSRCGDRSEHLLDEAVGALDLIRDFDVGHRGWSSSGGSPCLSAICWHTLAISVPHFEHDAPDVEPDRKVTARRTPRRQARQMRQHGASDAVDQCIDIRPAHQFAPLLH
jgi:hypothetical protein